QYWTPPFPAVLGTVEAGGPADQAGLKVDDEIKSVDGTAIRSFGEFRDLVRARPGQEISVTVKRAGGEVTRRVNIASETDGGQTVGRLRIGPKDTGVPYPPEMRTHTPVGPLSALSYSVAKAWQMTAAQAKFFVRMLTGDVSWKNTSGFIGIAKSVGEAAESGVFTFLMMMVLLSLSLGLLNLLPIPILDGGQVVFQLVEWVKGSPLSDRAYLVGQQAGLLLLVLLMGVALFNDLSNLNF
ncbi:MAG TPA: RIP metalloprotease RseP, partial [Steroidobacteraceae bacterium]